MARSDLRDSSRRVLRLVVRANARADKTPVLLELREELESLKAMLRLAYDAKAIAGIASFEHGARGSWWISRSRTRVG